MATRSWDDDTLATPEGAHGSDRRIRVLALVKGLGAGGAERLLVSVARVSDRSRFQLEVAYVLPHKTAFVRPLQDAGVVVHCLSNPDPGPSAPTLLRWLRRLGWVHHLRRHLLEHRYEILHVHSPVPAAVARVVARTLPASHRPALVSTEHNSWDSYLRPTRWVNASLHWADAARFAVSTEARESMWRPWRRGVEVLAHGVVLEDYTAAKGSGTAVRARLGVPPEAVVVTTVANLRREKGYPELLQAAAKVLNSEPDVVFLAAGQGDQAADLLRQHARHHLGAGFRFLGQVDDIPSLLAATDIFVLPSRFEGQPIAIMEALCVGLPVVATRVGGIPEQVSHDVEGLLLPARDPDALARALLELVRDPQRRESMAQAAAIRGRGYDIRRAARMIEARYASLANAPRTARAENSS